MATYGQAVIPQLMQQGVKILVASPVASTYEGEWQGNFTVVLEFESMEKATGFFNSEAYLKVRPLRHANSTLNNMVFAPGFEVPKAN